MTASLTTVRHGIRDVVADTVTAGVAVWPSPPTTVTAPGVYLLPTGARQTTACLFDADFTVRCVGPGGDNEAGLAELETLTTQLVVALVAAYPSARVTVGPPTVETVAGGAALVLDLTLTLTIRMEAT